MGPHHGIQVSAWHTAAAAPCPPCSPPPLQPLIFVLVLEAIGADQPGSWFLLELDAEQCSKERLVGTIRCVDG